MAEDRVYLFDTTLRDGGQTQGVDFNTADKNAIAGALDKLGIDYIEAGWPGANPTDDAVFANPPVLSAARLVAFGMTRRSGRSADNDPGLNAVVGSGAPIVCLVGKTWDFHVDVALGISRSENVEMIGDSIAHALAKPHIEEAMFDAEHFFDGYKANRDHAMDCVRSAHEAGAQWIVLCDTNGGTLPHEIERIVAEVTEDIPGDRLGIHCHDDTQNAVANSLAAVRAGVRQVQGTLNGLGERCGNANIVSLIPTLTLKMGFKTGVGETQMRQLTHVSRGVDERINRPHDRHAAYVGEAAFAHKGGLHVSAVQKDPRTYEHLPPETVGNRRHIVVSDQAGRSNVLARFEEIGLDLDPSDPKVERLLEVVKDHAFKGYAYDGADASFELLARRMLGEVPEFFRLNRFHVIDERRFNARGELTTRSEAIIQVVVGDEEHMDVGEGNGPVDALDSAIRKVLLRPYPMLSEMRLVDYKVRILTPDAGSAAVTRVMIESGDSSGKTWATVGVSGNIIDASYNAMHDAIVYKLFHDGAQGIQSDRRARSR